ncbi:SA1788 family PVL leukocidin-associated protein [Staphylococcus auricularis]|uniref:SA1788 family PVL leukocidin-associated protein n=1 Tax=Staphylococcus auricularis TaxID=29379 RepID=UPI001F1D5D0C|nr:SA1788 family PVL leukocidin-associated protein [Staphylococcus auricularis]MCE5038412.1 hypothetical protein [Staphylococcus auricularis]
MKQVEVSDYIQVNEIIYTLNEKQIKQMEEKRLSKMLVRQRLKIGWPLNDAVQVPKDTNRETWLENQKAMKALQERLDRERRREEAKLRKKKPHLFHVPQKHQMGRYAKHLFKHNAMVKIKKDKYGRVQRG